MKYISRYYNLKDYLEPNKVVIIFGPRQIGKTTLLNNFLKKTKLKYKLDSGDNISLQDTLGSQDFKKINEFTSGYELIIIDEAQNIPNIGMGLKIIVDHTPKIYVIATGSATFELAGQIGEPLTGRKKTLILYPISQLELALENNPYELKQQLPELLVFGSYPRVATADSKNKKREILKEIINSYLLKDILSFEQVKGAKTLLDLLRLVAFQVGSEVSLTELGNALEIDYKTVARYLDLFEKSFILFNLRGFSRNLRKEISKKSKYYFYDNGIRNAIISNFNDLELRNDIGQLWENFIVVERQKKQTYHKIYANNYFWRTWDQQEIDWVEEREGKLFGYEFTYSASKSKAKPKDWFSTYSNAEFEVINSDNYLEFVT
jgi:predicted AAA+ superfamily ATPase